MVVDNVIRSIAFLLALSSSAMLLRAVLIPRTDHLRVALTLALIVLLVGKVFAIAQRWGQPILWYNEPTVIIAGILI